VCERFGDDLFDCSAIALKCCTNPATRSRPRMPRTSPDFRPAHDPLLRMTNALARVDAPEARVLLTELQRAPPLRAEAAQALRELSRD
jgi:hypothetical protein